MRAASRVVLLFALVGCGRSPQTSDAIRGDIGDAGAVSDGGRPDSGVCTVRAPSGCEEPVPSYAGEIASLIAARCGPCHGPGGAASEKPLRTYADVYDLRTGILGQINACRMPPLDAGQPSDEERRDLLDWLVCGAPAN